MALFQIIRLSLRIVSSIVDFLLGDETQLSSANSPLTVPTQHHSLSESSSFLDGILTHIASSFDLSLPRSVTVFNELPVITSFLLRLTEIVAPEILLFLVLFGSLSLIVLCGIGVGLFAYILTKIFQYTISNVSELRVTPIVQEPEEPLTDNTLTAASRPFVLSDVAQSIAP